MTMTTSVWRLSRAANRSVRTSPAILNPIVHPVCKFAPAAASGRWTCPRCLSSPWGIPKTTVWALCPDWKIKSGCIAETDDATCSRDSSRLSFMSASWEFSSSTSVMNFRRRICKHKNSAQTQRFACVGHFAGIHIPVSRCCVERRCRSRSWTAWSENRDRGRSWPTWVWAAVYEPVCGTRTASPPPGVREERSGRLRWQCTCTGLMVDQEQVRSWSWSSTHSLFGFGQSDLLVPLVLLCLFQRLGEAAEGLLELLLLPVDPLNVGWRELLLLVLELEFEPLVVLL